ncbi:MULTISPECIES: hypothetical protein [unclassified Providencia]|uniref:hypothetical protein n=1 Tax=unclassified Providencia TaxID=2633465 RepID=UPI000F4A67CC|nr:hypothetical protein [Providencia sp. PROV128]
MNKSTLNKVGIALLLFLFSHTSFSSTLKDDDTYIPKYTDFILECSDYIVGEKHPNNATEKNLPIYLSYHQVSESTGRQITEELMKLKRFLPKLNLPAFLNGRDREYAITFCAVVTHDKIKALEKSLSIKK